MQQMAVLKNSKLEGINYDEISAPVTSYTSIRIIISLAVVFFWLEISPDEC
jgi:hypothetical protein